MTEDLKIKASVDIKQAERDLKSLEKIEPKINIDTILKIRNKNEKIKEIKQLQKEIQLVKLNPGAFPDGELKKLNQQLKQAKEELKGMKSITTKSLFKESYEDARKLAEKVKEIKLNPKNFSSEDIKLLRAEIEATALKAKAIKFAEGNSKSQSLINNLTNSSKELDKISSQVGYTNKTFGIMDVTIGNIAANLAMGVLRTLKDITLEGAKFNQQMEFATEKVRTISSSGGLEINSNIWKMAKATGVNPLELNEGLYQTVSAIGDIHKKYTLLETANKLATTGFSTTTEAVDGLTTVLNAYNLEVEEAERIANIFVRTQKVGKLTVQEFNRELYKTIPVAKELQIGVDEVGASIALLTAKGSKAEIAQTQMGAFMYELLDIGSDVSKLFEKIAGQSLDNFMSNGGNFEGVLRLFKGYSDTNNFKIESLLGRKEAKSFWLNVGKDIDGYIEKLNAINDPVNELQRNFENLLNTQEKRLARASNYWLAFKQVIGEVSGEVLASIGDFITGADTESAARQRLNNELDNNLKTLEELSKKQSLTKDEQNTLNTALESLTVLAPNVAEAYRNWSVNGGSYAEVLKEIHKAQLEVNKEHSNMTLKSFDKELAQLEKEYKELEKKLYRGKNKTVHQKDYSLVGKVKDGRISKEKTPEEYYRVKELIYMKNSLFNKIKSKKKERSLYLEKLENKTEALTENPSSKEKVDEKKSQPKEVNGDFTNWDSKYKELEIKRQQDLIQAKENYIKELSLATEDTRTRIDENYHNKVAKIEDDTKISKLEIEINELKARIQNTNDTSTIENIKSQINAKIIEKNDIEANANLRELENKKNQDKLRKIEEEKQFKIQEQNIKNNFNEKRIEIEKKYQENLKGMENSFSQERYNKLKEEREKELSLINTDEKIALLKLRKEKLDPKKDSSEIKAIDNELITTKLDFDTSRLEKETKDRIEELQESITLVTRNLNNLARVFEATGNRTASNVMKGASAIFDTIGNMSPEFIDKFSNSLGFTEKFKDSKVGQGLTDIGNGMAVGSTIDSLISGGSKEGQIGSIAGAAIGTAVGGPIGAVVGSSISGSIGGVFGKKKKKKAKKEKKKYEEAQRRLEQGRISGQYTFQETMEQFNEELEKSGLANKINMFESVSKNTNYDNIKTALQGGAKGPDGVSISVLKELMPHMTEQEIFDWFKATTGGAVVNGDTISTGEGKYGAINLGALAEQITQMNRELEKSLKETIKNIIDFSADKISGIVKNGFGDGIDDLGKNLEKAIADSLKNAFLQTEMAKGLFNGLSDKVSKMITDMFKNDKNLGIDLEIGKLEDLTLQEYIELIKKYMELGNDQLSSIFKELGLSLDNLNNTVEKANKNSKNTVQGMATNLWLQNIGKKSDEIIKNAIDSNRMTFKLIDEKQKINLSSNREFEKNIFLELDSYFKNLKIDIPNINLESQFQLYLDGKALDSKIVKVLQNQTMKNNRNKLSVIRG
ncbi:phage tail tape measure protein [Cetobacterium somerae]|uniref:phage tail tape measure protein n=1 Tax=Cetobacterium somerae TaxID=188913 RepID=UPI00211F0D90|nr:phage tail tape measure protein [Cetobacterium somerae]MCQ9628090.1 phage tail tape measure protein [Cetobacterium somerae]